MIRISALLLACLCLAGCGSKKAQAPTTTQAAATTTVATTTTTSSSAATTAPAPTSPGALQAEVAATAAGDIPDNQVFVSYPGKAFSMKFPEGWTQSGKGNNVTFRDKNNIVRIVIVPGGPATTASVEKEVAALKGATPSGSPAVVKIGGRPAIKATYRATSAPNAVTGKTVTLTVDRYELAKNGKRVIVDLGSPVGVDNVDAYRLMIESLRVG